MNVLIYIPPPPERTRGEQRELPIGALVIGTYAKHAGHNVKIIDGLASNSFSEAGFVPDVVGVSMLTMYSALVMDEINAFIADVRKVSNPIIVFGGPGSSVLSEPLLNDKIADYVVFGPGEDVLVELLTALEAGSPVRDVSDIAYLDEAGSFVKAARTRCSGPCLSLQTDYTLMDITGYINPWREKEKSVGIMTSRGCLYRCTFCFNEAFYGCAYQVRPVSVIIAEMKYLNEHYGIVGFRFFDECFGFDKAWLHELCNAIIAELPPVKWFCMYRGGMNARADYELMYRAGCRVVSLGIETADPQMSKKILKNIDIDSLPAEIEMLQEMGFWVFGYFIFGFPDETREQLKNTCDFMMASKCDFFYLSIFYLIPETRLFDELVSGGRVKAPKTIEEFQAYLSPKRYPNYSQIPARDLDVVYAFMNLAFRFGILFEKGKMLSNLKTYIIARTQGSGGGGLRYLFTSWAHYLKMMWYITAHPLIRRRYGLLFRNFKRYPHPATPD